MKRKFLILTVLMLIFGLMLSACNDDSNTNEANENNTAEVTERNDNNVEVSESDDNEVATADNLDEWIQQVNDGTLPKMGGEGELDYGLGYFLYYAPIDSTGLDNLIYNGLVIHKQLEDGDISADSLTQGQQNLLDITDGIVFNPEVEITAQIGQTEDVRQTIFGRLTADQQGMSPKDALEANAVSGILATNSGEDIGKKYLVYGQPSPDADFEFVGTILAVDASGSGNTGQSYSFQGWDSLPLLGDASGPFWNLIPTGMSGDPANTNEGRPGVLLISQSTYQEIEG